MRFFDIKYLPLILFALALRSCLKISCQPVQLGMFELCLTKTTQVI